MTCENVSEVKTNNDIERTKQEKFYIKLRLLFYAVLLTGTLHFFKGSLEEQSLKSPVNHNQQQGEITFTQPKQEAYSKPITLDIGKTL